MTSVIKLVFPKYISIFTVLIFSSVVTNYSWLAEVSNSGSSTEENVAKNNLHAGGLAFHSASEKMQAYGKAS